jgi:hypothetical protein
MQANSKRSTNGLVAVAAIAGVGLLLVIILMVAGGGGQPTQPAPGQAAVPTPVRPALPRANPEQVSQRMVDALRKSDTTAIFNDLTPGLASTFSISDFATAAKAADQKLGAVTDVRLVTPPAVKTEAPWNGEWADGEVAVVRGQVTTTYVVRYRREGGQWWFFGTIERGAP